jgi:phosphoribosylformylglycinamidine synthase subunit PurQ / glutaminase
MPQPRVLILRAPGTNCDVETAFAFERAGAWAERVHVNRLLERPALLEAYQVLCIPGGFSYGDDVAAGRILANQVRHHLAEPIRAFRDSGRLILGICNGFQVLLKCDLLLEADPALGPPATLTYNDSGRFEDRWVRLGASGTKCVFLDGIEEMELPVAHGEGKFVARDPAALDALGAAGQLVLRYLPLDGRRRESFPTDGRVSYPDNPNGSTADVAGVCDATGRVLGLMPHPERHIDPTHHPRWPRGQAGPAGDGLQLFVNAVRYFA